MIVLTEIFKNNLISKSLLAYEQPYPKRNCYTKI